MTRPTLAVRVEELRTAVAAAEGRLDAAVVDGARRALARVEERAQLSAEHTVVALAGATGAGKSTIFNLLAGADLARTGTQRPTTSFPLAVIAESPDISAGSTALLDWLGVHERHDLAVSTRHPNGLVLLDLPDHDSIVAEHRLRADHVTARADLLVWVTNPQKYADGVLHNRYLAALVGRDDAVAVVLNQVDRLDVASRRVILADLERLVRADGLDARIVGTSGISGEGVDELRALIARAVVRRESATARLTAEVRAAGEALSAALPSASESPAELSSSRRRLLQVLGDAAGVPLVVEAVRGASVRDAIVRTGWPPLRWIRALRADPLRGLGLRGRPSRGAEAVKDELVRTSLPSASPAVRAQVATATRAYVEAASRSLPPRAREDLNARSVAAAGDIADALDAAVVHTVRLRPARWWGVADLAQWLLLVTALAGAVWLGGLALLDYLRVPTGGLAPTFPVGALDLPWPTTLLIGGIVAGLCVAGVCRLLAHAGANRRASRVGRDLRSGVESVAVSRIVGDVEAERAALTTLRKAAARASA